MYITSNEIIIKLRLIDSLLSYLYLETKKFLCTNFLCDKVNGSHFRISSRAFKNIQSCFLLTFRFVIICWLHSISSPKRPLVYVYVLDCDAPLGMESGKIPNSALRSATEVRLQHIQCRKQVRLEI